MTDSEDEGKMAEHTHTHTRTHTHACTHQITSYHWLNLFVAVDDFIVDELGRPINRKKGGDQSTDM